MSLVLADGSVGDVGRSRLAVLPMGSFDGRPTIMIRINDQGPYRFVLDTASEGSMIDAELAESLELPVVRTNTFGGPSNPQAYTAQTVSFGRIQVGDVELEDVEADVFDMMGFWQQEGPVGTLGVATFSDFRITLDFPGEQFRLSPESLPESESNLSFELDHGIPLVLVDFAGRIIPAHLDTGSSSGFTLPTRFLSELNFESEPVRAGRARTVGGEAPVLRARLRGDAILGTHRIERPEIRMTDALQDANIGVSILQRLVVTLDYRIHQVLLTHQDPLSSFGISLDSLSASGSWSR